MFFFFFSSRRRHTRCSRDWSSDVCSSDLFVEGVWDVLMLIVLKSFFFDFADRSGRGLHFILEVIFGLAGFRHANSQNVDQDYSLRDVGAEFGLVLSSFS